MPIYEYACDECGHRFDRLQSFRDDPVEVCPECGKSACRRLISAPGIVFKGSGWYIKDSKSGSKGLGAAARPESGSGSESGGENGGKSDGGKNDGGSSSDGAPAAGSGTKTSGDAASSSTGSKKADA